MDASVEIGTGHVMRCLTLAQELKNNNTEVIFICRDLQGNLAELIRKKGFNCALLSKPSGDIGCQKDGPKHEKWLGVSWKQDANDSLHVIENSSSGDWLVVDHYGLDARWHKEIRKKIKRVLVIDDLADRALDCDLMLDQNFYLNSEVRYENLISQDCSLLLGPRYAMLRDEFISQSDEVVNLDEMNIKRILVFMGGADYTNETEKTILALDGVTDIGFEVDVVVSSVNPLADKIKELCSLRANYTYHKDITYMSELMKRADLAIGAGGATVIERCYLGVPSLVTLVAENQKETTLAYEEVGVLKCLGWYEYVTCLDISNAVVETLCNSKVLKSMRENSAKIVDIDSFLGVKFVASKMLNKYEKL